MSKVLSGITWKGFFLFLGLVVAMVAALAALMRVRGPESLTFVVTGDTQAYLVPCGCKVTPSGGLPRRAAYLEQTRILVGEDAVIPVEIGHPFTDRGPGKDLLNRALAVFFEEQRYGIVGIGGYDLLMGLDSLKALSGGLPLTLAGTETLPGSREYELGGWGIGAIGRRGIRFRVAILAETPPGGARLPDPVDAFRKERDTHPCEGWIVMGEIRPETAEVLLKEFPDVIAIAAQWRGIITSTPQNALDRWVVYLGDRGRRVCTLEVSRRGGTLRTWPNVRYLASDMPSDEALAAKVEGVLDEVASMNREALKAQSMPPGEWNRYVGSEACGRCHGEEYRKWAKSGHAKARESLLIDHQQDNPDCLKCHSTNFGMPGGFPNDALDLSGVHCEACHGPGGGHPPRGMQVPEITGDFCVGCHSQRDSPLFDPEGFWQLVRHGEGTP